MPHLNLHVNKDIVINKTMFENFISLIEKHKRKPTLHLESNSLESLDRSEETLDAHFTTDITVDSVQTCVLKGLECVVNKLMELKNNPE